MHRNKSTSTRATRPPQLDVSQFVGEWVAFHPKTYRVLGHGASPDEAIQGVTLPKGAEPVLYFVPKSDAFFVGPAT